MIELLLLVIVLGVIMYFVETYLPMSPPFKTLLRVIVVVIIIMLVIRWFGLDLSLPARLR